METSSRIFVAGHLGLLGTALLRKLSATGDGNVITRSRSELDLRDQADVRDFFATEKIEYVFLAAAKVGGISAIINRPAEFMYDNLAIELNVVDAAYRSGVSKLLFVATSNIYPPGVPQPVSEDQLLAAPLDPTVEPYALAKIAGIKLCQSYNRQYGTNFISVVPCNLYGPNDNFDPESATVLPALIHRFDDAKKTQAASVDVWGTGKARREFMHADDLADACLFLMDNYDDSEIINVGAGTDISVVELAHLVKDVVGYQGEIRLDASRPDGIPRKLVNVERLSRLGWRPAMSLKEGIEQTYAWFIDSVEDEVSVS